MPVGLKCSKCETLMLEGFIPDTGDHAVAEGQVWVDQTADTSFLQKVFGSNGNNAYKITTFRCPACGFLESYADERNDLSII